MNYTPTYLGEIPLDEETLTHYGVKGMKWGRRKNRPKKKTELQKRRYYAQKMAEDVIDGRRRYGNPIVRPGKGTIRGVAPQRNGDVATANVRDVSKGGSETRMASQSDFEKEYMKRLRRQANRW